MPYNEEDDSYTEPTDAQRLAYLERQVKDLFRMVSAVSYPNRRNAGGAVDSD